MQSAFQTENLVLSRRIYISLILWNIVNSQIRTTTKSLKKLTITYLSIGREGASLRGDIWQDTGKVREVCPSHTKDMLLVWILCKLPSEMISDRRTKSALGMGNPQIPQWGFPLHDLDGKQSVQCGGSFSIVVGEPWCASGFPRTTNHDSFKISWSTIITMGWRHIVVYYVAV